MKKGIDSDDEHEESGAGQTALGQQSAEDSVFAGDVTRLHGCGELESGGRRCAARLAAQGDHHGHRQRRQVHSATPGTTQSLIQGLFGPFTLVDTPGHLPDMQETGAKEAAVIVMLLDGTKPLRPEERALFERLQALKRPLVVAMNKSDLIRGNPEVTAASFAAQLGVNDVIPISAITGANITSDLIPTIIDASPEAALAIGKNLPEYRRTAADKVIRNAALVCLAAGLEPIPLVDIPVILGAQIRMILRLGAMYGEPLSSQHVRELIGAIAGSLTLRYLAEEAAKAVPFGGDLVSGAIAGAGTWAIGTVALEYYESGKKLTAAQMRAIFNRVYTRLRNQQRGAHTRADLQLPQRVEIDDE
jgi:uncharacterized protein (DUF697 family)